MRSTTLRGILLFLSAILITGFFYTSQTKVARAYLDPTISISPSSNTVPAGADSTVAYYINVGVSGLPEFENEHIVLSTFETDPSLAITFTPNNRPIPFLSTMTVHVSASTRPGQYPINVRARNSIGQVPYLPYIGDDEIVYLEVRKIEFTTTLATIITPTTTHSIPTYTPTIITPTPPSKGLPFDFNLEVTPPTLEVERSLTANYKIHIAYGDPSYSGVPIDIQLDGHGPGMNWQATPAGDLSITTSSNTPLGSYTIMVIGSAQGVSHQTSATLVVTEGPPQEQPPLEESLPEEPPSEEPFPEEPSPEEIPPEEIPEEYAPITPSIMLSTGIHEEVITVHGSISPPLIGEETATVDIRYTSPKGEEIAHTVPIMGYDTFEDSYQPTIKGTWTIIAEWRGTDMYLSASSQPASVTFETEGFPYPLDPLILIIGILAIIVIALVVAIARRERTKAIVRPQAKSGYCISCGTPLKNDKAFCNSCGERVEY